jgi:hypothetical protein
MVARLLKIIGAFAPEHLENPRRANYNELA